MTIDSSHITHMIGSLMGPGPLRTEREMRASNVTEPCLCAMRLSARALLKSKKTKTKTKQKEKNVVYFVGMSSDEVHCGLCASRREVYTFYPPLLFLTNILLKIFFFSLTSLIFLSLYLSYFFISLPLFLSHLNKNCKVI